MLVCAFTGMLVGCELTQITLATPEDIIVAEILLRAGETRQRAYLHRTGGGDRSARVLGAHIRVTEEGTSRELAFDVAADSLCVTPSPDQTGSSIGTCYVADGPADMVRPGGRYNLLIDVDSRVLSASTQVPGSFRLLRPAQDACRLPADTVLELQWTRAAGAWVYVVEGRFGGLRRALRDRGVDVPLTPQPIELTGLSVSGSDTTLVFPSELGVFQRFDAELHPVLIAIAGGLPPGTITDLTVAAGDRNYVNWVRGGAFNPSGQVRIPSVHGDGTGVFGSLVPLDVIISTRADTQLPACL